MTAQPIDYKKVAEQVQVFTRSMDGLSGVGRAYLLGAETAMLAVADALDNRTV